MNVVGLEETKDAKNDWTDSDFIEMRRNGVLCSPLNRFTRAERSGAADSLRAFGADDPIPWSLAIPRLGDTTNQ